MNNFVFHEPANPNFDRDGHTGKFFGTESDRTQHLIVETQTGLTVSLVERECEFNYYILEGEGTFTINDTAYSCTKGDLIVIPPGNKFTYAGKLRMLLINTPKYRAEQEEVL